MNTTRLAKLADILENFKVERKNLLPLPQNGPVGKFSLNYWGNDTGNACSTTACAAGTAALHPVFHAQGLHLTRDRRTARSLYEIRFEDAESFDACKKFFDISHSDAVFLFSPGSYAYGRQGEKSVAKRIRYLIAGGKNRTRHAGFKSA